MKKLIFCFNIILTLSVFFITCNPTELEEPELSVQPAAFSFTKDANTDILVISNSGSGELSWEITDKPDWLEVSKSSGKVTTGTDTVNVIANLIPGAGNYSGRTISIEANDGNEGITISINIIVWIQRKSIPTARSAHCVGIVNSKIYAIGGSQQLSRAVEEYDPVTNTWTTKAYMPTNRGYLACSVVDGKIYAIGGYNPATVSTVEEYDPATDTWTTKSPMPTARWGHATATVNGKIYAIGGATGWPAMTYGKVEEYDPMTDTWTTKASMPTPRWMLSVSVVNGKIYAFGGFNDFSISTVEEYDPATDTWTTKSPMPTARWGLTTGTVNGKIYAIGGGNTYLPTVCYRKVEEYDPVMDSWTTKSRMPVGRIGHAPHSVSVDGKIYVIGGGGLTADEAYAQVYEYEPGLDS